MVVASGANSYAKEMAIRRRIASIFNKREDDFPSLRDYNDYLEEVEDMTFNLIEGVDVAVIEGKINQYEKENAEQIINSRARKAEEHAAALAASKAFHIQPDATDAAATQSSQVAENVAGQMQYAPAMAGIAFGQPRPTGMAGQPFPVGGYDSQGSAMDEEERMKLRAERGPRAGGYSLELTKKRAIEEAFGSMWI